MNLSLITFRNLFTLGVVVAAALAAGTGKASAQEYHLSPEEEPIVLRTFMPDSSPRSIAVGLPGGQSYCFDAGECRLRYAWTGGFLDAGPVWGGRGGQQANLLGEKFYVAADGFPLRVGDPGNEPEEVRFRGYTLVNDIPRFHYEIDGIEVFEYTAAAPSGDGLVQSFEVGVVDEPVWFIAGEGADVVVSSPYGDFVNGRLKIDAGDDIHFEVHVLRK